MERKTKFSGKVGFILSAAGVLLSVSLMSGCGGLAKGYPLPAKPEEAEVYVEPISGLSADFIRGVDLSSILAQEKSGVVYYNEAGKEQDIFQTLAQNGVNYIRVRVWNDPYDADGNGYGGGNCDAESAAEIGKRAAKYGMKLCVDFHYSDFWADPNKQMCPKAWSGYGIAEKTAALAEFTEESLNKIISAGADVGMVQLGNEINNGLSGELTWIRMAQLLTAGSEAVRKVAKDKQKEIKIAVHFTNVSDQEQILYHVAALKEHEVDYDVFAVSYYPFWHGTVENLTDILKQIVSATGKEVMVAENSYTYTAKDGDGTGNSVSGEEPAQGYPVSEQGQAYEIRDVCAAVAAVGEAGIGYFYWEPAWIPVGIYDAGAADANAVLAANKESWEKNGSGWASSFASSYDPEDAGQYYGGSSWDNQALFDFSGHPLASLKTFRYLQCGTIVERKLEKVIEPEIDIRLNGEVALPQTVEAVFNDRTTEEWPVEWDAAQLSAVDSSRNADYQVTGTVQPPAGVSCPDKITAVIHIRLQNLVLNPSFEEADVSMWKAVSEESGVPDYQKKADDAYSGDIALHFWSTRSMDFTVEQEITGLEPGIYQCGAFLQGDDVGEDAKIYIYADTASDHQEAPVTFAGWCVWQKPVIDGLAVGEDGVLTIGASVSCQAKGWGTLDDFYVYRVG